MLQVTTALSYLVVLVTIFLKVITSKIDSYMNSLNLWCINQCDFKKDHRTEDNLFILNTIHKKWRGQR